MLKTLARSSHIWRGVDPAEPSNRLALAAFAIGAVVATVVGLVSGDAGVGGAMLDGLRYGLGAFLAWAVTRELDPDNTASARFAVLAYVAVAFTGVPDVAAVAAVLIAVRLVVRSTGRPPTRLDYGLIIALGALAATSTTGFVTALGLTWALHVDRRLHDPAPDRDSEIAAALMATVAIIVTIVSGALFSTAWELPGWLDLLVIVATAAGAVALRATSVSSVADRTRVRLSLDRLVHGRRLALVILVAATLWSGASAIGALGPVFAAVIGAGLASSGALERVSSAVARD